MDGIGNWLLSPYKQVTQNHPDRTHNCLLSMEIEPKDPFAIVSTIGRE